jgi:hypothetical protein
MAPPTRSNGGRVAGFDELSRARGRPAAAFLLIMERVNRLDSHPGRTPDTYTTPYGDRIESLTVPAVVGGITPRLVVRSTPSGGLFVRIELPRNSTE